jgi:hypothetical protein
MSGNKYEYGENVIKYLGKYWVIRYVHDDGKRDRNR